MDHLTLTSIIGNSCTRSTQLTHHPTLPIYSYPCGTHVILYNYLDHCQTCIRTSSGLAVSCLNFTSSYLLVGQDSKSPAIKSSPNPSVLVYDLSSYKLLFECTEIKSSQCHTYPIIQCCFNADTIYALSSTQHVQQTIIAWDTNGSQLFTISTSNVTSFCFSGLCLVTFGPVILFHDLSLNDIYSSPIPADLEHHTDLKFVHCSSDSTHVYGITHSGFLMAVNSDSKVLEKWVHLKIDQVTCIQVVDSFIFCAGSSDKIRVFHTISLKYKTTFPHFNVNSSITALRVNQTVTRMAVTYHDKSICILNCDSLLQPYPLYTLSPHSGCIWGIVPINESFYSYSSDKSIKFWDIKTQTPVQTLKTNGSIRASCTSDPYIFLGDTQGNVKIHQSNPTTLSTIEAHDSEITCLCVSSPSENIYLCSGSRDRLVHIFNITDSFKLVQTLDDHTSTITCIKFVNGYSMLISSSLDHSIRIRYYDSENRIWVHKRTIISRNGVHDFVIDKFGMKLIVPRNNGIEVFDLNNGESRILSVCNGISVSRVFQGTCESVLFLCMSDKRVICYDIQSECVLWEIECFYEPVVCVLRVFGWVIVCCCDGSVFFWSVPIRFEKRVDNQKFIFIGLLIRYFVQGSWANNIKTPITLYSEISSPRKINFEYDARRYSFENESPVKNLRSDSDFIVSSNDQNQNSNQVRNQNDGDEYLSLDSIQQKLLSIDLSNSLPYNDEMIQNTSMNQGSNESNHKMNAENSLNELLSKSKDILNSSINPLELNDSYFNVVESIMKDGDILYRLEDFLKLLGNRMNENHHK